jgi:hypothetical protein
VVSVVTGAVIFPVVTGAVYWMRGFSSAARM